MVDKIMDPALAARAYGNTTGIGKVGIPSDNDGVSFSDFLKHKARESVETLHQSEQMSAKAITGEADVTDVVQAVNSAEVALSTAVAIRDRLISAYQEIMRMPI